MVSQLLSKVPPNNIEAEQAVLGAILLNWTAMADIITILKSDKFYSLQNQVIFDALTKLYTQNITGDTISLINQLKIENKLEQAGGTAYIASLTDTVGSAANVDYYAKIVIDCSIRRELIKISSETQASSYELSRESNAILDEAEQKIFGLAEKKNTVGITSARDIMFKEIELIDRRYKSKNQFTGIPTGFPQLDARTSGFQNSELIIIGARPSIGKTALALSMMQNIACENKIPCGFFSLEMPNEAIGMRLLSQESKVPMYKIRSGMLKLDDLKRIQDAAGRWFEAPFYTVDIPNMRLLDLRAMARRMVSKYQVKIIFIDYLGLITTENPNAQTFEQVAEISKSLKALARELAIPIVALSQVARDAEGAAPNLAQIRGSGAVEQDADVVMFLHRERLKEDIEVQDAKLILAKQRNGATGDIDILFLPALSRFVPKVDE